MALCHLCYNANRIEKQRTIISSSFRSQSKPEPLFASRSIQHPNKSSSASSCRACSTPLPSSPWRHRRLVSTDSRRLKLPDDSLRVFHQVFWLPVFADTNLMMKNLPFAPLNKEELEECKPMPPSEMPPLEILYRSYQEESQGILAPLVQFSKQVLGGEGELIRLRGNVISKHSFSTAEPTEFGKSVLRSLFVAAADRNGNGQIDQTQLEAAL